MSEDTRRVLDMLAQGKISVDEAHRLLAAIGPATTGSASTSSAASGSASTGGAANAAKGTATAEAPTPKFLRITVTKTSSWPHDERGHWHRARMWPGAGDQSKEITIRVPVGLVRNGMRLGAMIPGLRMGGLQARLRERGVDVDLSKIDAETIDQLVREFGEMNIDVVSERGAKAQVRITCE